MSGLNIEALTDQLPPYLREERRQGFLAALKSFPDCKPLYKRIDDPEPLQGDCWDGVVFLQYPTGERKRTRGLLLTNSCDASSGNERLSPAMVSFVPVINLAKYESALMQRFDRVRVRNHIEDVRAQKYTSIFFLPPGGGLQEESIAVLDSVQSVPLDAFVKDESVARVSSLSDIGFYLFVFKLSFHFCRLHENIDRTPDA